MIWSGLPITVVRSICEPVSGFLLDTNIVSEFTKPQPFLPVFEWLKNTNEELLFLSVLTLGEIRKGIDRLDNPARRIALESWLEGDLRVRFAGRILPVDEPVADRWGRIAAQGRTLAIVDGLLAATALHYNLTMVTRNAKDMISTGCAAFNPWET